MAVHALSNGVLGFFLTSACAADAYVITVSPCCVNVGHDIRRAGIFHRPPFCTTLSTRSTTQALGRLRLQMIRDQKLGDLDGVQSRTLT